jgi:hypothetical protein
MTQPPLTEGPQPEPARRHRRHTMTRDVAAIGGILAVGAMWWFLAAAADADSLPITYNPSFETVVLLSLALPAVFGATMSTVRGFVMSAVLVATVTGSIYLNADTSGPDYSGLNDVAIFILAFVTSFVVALAWLGGLVMGSAWRWARRRWST